MSEEDSQQDNFEDQFKAFLAQNKIDTSGLAGTKEEGRLLRSAEDQRTVSILKAVNTTCFLYDDSGSTAIPSIATTSIDSRPTRSAP